MEKTDRTITAGSAAGKILVADDDEPFRLGLGKILTRAGFECDLVGSAAAAIEHLRAREYDVLLSDINMPGNAGLELIENLPTVVEGLPIILLTGNATVETAMRSVGLRVRAYLTKPPDFDELCGLLKTAVGECRNVRRLMDNRRRLQEWEHEVERLQKLLQHAPPAARPSTMQSYLQLTLRQLVVGLVELEHLLVHEGERSGADQIVEKQALLEGVRKTIGVLQKTKDHFKSKDLGDLRKDLEKLLG
jgi:DNA-binding response OmpR family regulator